MTAPAAITDHRVASVPFPRLRGALPKSVTVTCACGWAATVESHGAARRDRWRPEFPDPWAPAVAAFAEHRAEVAQERRIPRTTISAHSRGAGVSRRVHRTSDMA